MASILQEGFQDDETNLYPLFIETEKIFMEIVQENWDMEKLYADLSFAKQQLTLGKEKELTPFEKQYLHSLLVFHTQRFSLSLEMTKVLKIIEKEREELEAIETILEPLTSDLHRYIEIITSQSSNTLNGWRTAAKLLENADYKKSRFSTLRSKIKQSDAEILKASLYDLGITFKTNADIRGSGRTHVHADIVAVLEGKFDIGWVVNKDGYFDIVADLWGVAKKYNQTLLITSINHKFSVNKTLAQLKNRGTAERVNLIRKSKCPRCESTQTIRYGHYNYKQNYKCQNCGTQFTED
jgi:hypothetical protein